MIWNRIQANTLDKRITSVGRFDAPSKTNDEIDTLAQLAHHLHTLPRKTAPTPHRSRAYLLAEHQAHVHTGLRLIRFSSYVGGATLLVGLALTTVFAASAHPGNPLYAYKLKSEQLRLRLTTNPESKLDLQLSFVENRIRETESTLNDDRIDTATKVAALQELTTQTKAAVETAREVAAAQKNPTILDKIELLTQSQVKVLTKNPDTSTSLGSDALAAAQENSKTIAAAKLLVAASQESDVTNLPATTQVIKGVLSAVTVSQISIDDISIATNGQTEIKYSKPELKDPKAELKVGQMVSITAVKTGTLLTAQSILVVPTPGKVKNNADIKNDGIIDTKNTLPPASEEPAEAEKVQSGFQIENPSPLYPSNP